jgi:ribosomal protein S18 acetylase RimI-like enzyme
MNIHNHTVSIRKVDNSDLNALQKISRRTFYETFAAVNTEANMTKYLEEQLSEQQLRSEVNNPESVFYLALLNDEVVGYLKLNFGQAQTVAGHDHAIEIERIYVAQRFWGKDLGKQLFQKALDVAHEKNADYIWLGVWQENPRAIRFYQKNGFEIFDTHLFMLGDDPQKDYLMKLVLKES